jgi:hypothetical protein
LNRIPPFPSSQAARPCRPFLSFAVRSSRATILTGALIIAGARATEWKPVAPTETQLYAVDFETEAPGSPPASVQLAGSGDGQGIIVDEHGSKVLQLSGREIGLTLPVVRLTECQLGNQNPTLITFSLKLAATEELRIVNAGGARPIVFARIGRGGAVFDGSESPEAPPRQRGTLQDRQWYQVYLNFDPSFKGYYLSFTGSDGARVEFVRRVKEVSYDFSLAVTASAPRGRVSLDNFRGITGFALDKMPRTPHLPKGDTYEPQPIVTTLTLAPASPDMTVRSGTLFETVKLAVPPSLDQNTIRVPAVETFRALGAAVRWDAAGGLLTIRQDDLEIRATAGSNIVVVNGASRNLSVPITVAAAVPLVPLDLFNTHPDFKAEWSAADKRAIIKNRQVRRTLSTRTTKNLPAAKGEVIVGAVPPAEPRSPVVLKYTFTNPAGRDGAAWATPAYQETDDWQPIASYSALENRLRAENRKEVWIRFQSTTTPETFNNTYFTAKHDGTISSFINGEVLRANVAGDGSRWVRFFNYITRKDVVGKPAQYGLHYKVGTAPLIDVELVRGRSSKPSELRNAGTWQGTEKVLAKDFKVVLDIAHIRDPQCIKGSDGFYYMVGTPFLHGSVPYARGLNEGIELFRAKTRTGPFESMGYVWKFDTAKWANTRYFTVDQERNIWAPEIHEFDGKWYLTYFPTKFPKNGLEGYSIFQIGIAVADHPLGPYTDTTDTPLVSAPDPHLFRDDDGSTYLTYGHGHIVKLTPTMDGLADTPRLIYPANAPYACNEGSTLFKANGKYFFGGAFSTYSFDANGKVLGQTYDCVLAEAAHVYGPYGDRYIGLKNAGNNSFFRDSDGKWYATIWQPGKITSIVEVEPGPDGKWRPASNYTVVPPEVRY